MRIDEPEPACGAPGVAIVAVTCVCQRFCVHPTLPCTFIFALAVEVSSHSVLCTCLADHMGNLMCKPDPICNSNCLLI